MTSQEAVERLEAVTEMLKQAIVEVRAMKAAPVAAPRPPPPSDGSAVFPNYGKSKGMPVAGATMNDLNFYRGGCLRTLGDESNSRFHEKERALLTAIDAEMQRQGVMPPTVGSFDPPPPSDADAPPLADDEIPF